MDDSTFSSPSLYSDLAVVLIGRNEGERLIRALASVVGVAESIVYVDSGSTDDSVAVASEMGVQVVQLDLSRPFTAARARNEGLHALRMTGSQPEFIQFVDGDCELRPAWMATARHFLESHPQAAIACGRLRERFPDASIWNRLCDGEWNTPVGRTRACGGIMMIRAAAFYQVGGFNPALTAGEEPELCVRLRTKGWEIWRLDAEMAWHDAAMTHFSQWWKRERRAGYAYAEGVSMHGTRPEYQHGKSALRRALLWGLGLPLFVFLVSLATPFALLLLFAYPLQFIRRLVKRKNDPHRWERALFDVLGKFPQALGCIEYARRSFGRTPNKPQNIHD